MQQGLAQPGTVRGGSVAQAAAAAAEAATASAVTTEEPDRKKASKSKRELRRQVLEGEGDGGGGGGTAAARSSPKKRKSRKRSEGDDSSEVFPPLKYPSEDTEPFDTGAEAGYSSGEEDSGGSREQRAWKQAVIQVWKQISEHKNALVFKEPVTNEMAVNYEETVHRRMDLTTIKKDLESGVLSTTRDFEHAVMLMFANALIYNPEGTFINEAALEMRKDSKQRFVDFRNIMSSGRSEKSSDSGREGRAGRTKESEKKTRGRRK